MTDADKRRAWVLAALDEYEVRLMRYAARLVGSDDLARDCVQHAFVKLCDGRANVPDTSPAAWLFRVCRNRALDHLRRAGRERSLESPPSEQDKIEPASRSGDPADLADARELSACLRQLVAELPGPQREAIDLWAEGFVYKQIGEITGHKEGHVRVLVHRGLKSLREHPQVRAWLEGSPPPPSADSSGVSIDSRPRAKDKESLGPPSVQSRREGTALRATP
jgi:RNA polymerase sigma factor (sigma-70 family)